MAYTRLIETDVNMALKQCIIIIIIIIITKLQNQLSILFSSSGTLKLKLSLEKSNIIVFQKGGYLAAREKWSFGDHRMEVVNLYQY